MSGQLDLFGGFSAGWGWVCCVLALNTIPEVAVLWFFSVAAEKYWIFDVCLAESFPSSVFCTIAPALSQPDFL